jgi:hypothetical protein
LARKNNVFVVSQSFAFLIGLLVARTQKGSKRAPPLTYTIFSALFINPVLRLDIVVKVLKKPKFKQKFGFGVKI